MADALGTYEEVLDLLNKQNQSITINNQIMSNKENQANAEFVKKEITADYIKKEFPDVTSAIIQEVSEDIKKSAFNEGVEAGKKQERDRILEIESAALPGHQDLIEEAKKDCSITA